MKLPLIEWTGILSCLIASVLAILWCVSLVSSAFDFDLALGRATLEGRRGGLVYSNDGGNLVLIESADQGQLMYPKPDGDIGFSGPGLGFRRMHFSDGTVVISLTILLVIPAVSFGLLGCVCLGLVEKAAPPAMRAANPPPPA